MRQIKPGDRVLVCWVGDDACVVDIITPKSKTSGLSVMPCIRFWNTAASLLMPSLPIVLSIVITLPFSEKVFNGEPVSDIITKLLEEVRQQTGDRCVALYKDGALTISGYGTNPDVYVFDTLNTISTSKSIVITLPFSVS